MVIRVLIILLVLQQMATGSEDSNTDTFLRGDINNYVFPEQAAAKQKELGTLPSLGCVGSTQENEVILLNGFSLNTLGNQYINYGELSNTKTDCISMKPIHPYFLKSKDNQLGLFTEYSLQGRIIKLTLTISEWDYVYGTKLNELERMECILRPLKDKDDTLKKDHAAVFSWESSLPEWSWQKGIPLVDDKESKQQLYEKTIEIHQALSDLAGGDTFSEQAQALKGKWEKSTKEFIQASEWRGKPYVFIDQLLEMSAKLSLPGNDFGSVTFHPLPELDELKIDIFADGTLARLYGTYRSWAWNAQLLNRRVLVRGGSAPGCGRARSKPDNIATQRRNMLSVESIPLSNCGKCCGNQFRRKKRETPFHLARGCIRLEIFERHWCPE